MTFKKNNYSTEEGQQFHVNRFWVLNVLLIVASVGVVIFGGLIPFYQNLIVHNISAYSDVSVFEKLHPNARISMISVWTDVNADRLFKLLIGLEAVILVIMLILKSKLVPIAVGSFVLALLSLVPALGFIYPTRILTLVVSLSWPVIVYAISELLSEVQWKRYIKQGAVAGFVLLAFAVEGPYIYDQAVNLYGWFIPEQQFEDTYKAFSWIETNTNKSDLILNDLTMASTYIDGTSLKNLSHSYASGWLKYPLDDSDTRLVMAKDLKKVWTQPWNQDLVNQLIDKYNVSYLVMMPMPGYIDYENWGGKTGQYTFKTFSNLRYEEIFDSYSFMEKVFKSGNAVIYSTKQRDEL